MSRDIEIQVVELQTCKLHVNRKWNECHFVTLSVIRCDNNGDDNKLIIILNALLF